MPILRTSSRSNGREFVTGPARFFHLGNNVGEQSLAKSVEGPLAEFRVGKCPELLQEQMAI
jgi:hypothetical protein